MRERPDTDVRKVIADDLLVSQGYARGRWDAERDTAFLWRAADLSNTAACIPHRWANIAVRTTRDGTADYADS